LSVCPKKKKEKKNSVAGIVFVRPWLWESRRNRDRVAEIVALAR